MGRFAVIIGIHYPDSPISVGTPTGKSERPGLSCIPVLQEDETIAWLSKEINALYKTVTIPSEEVKLWTDVDRVKEREIAPALMTLCRKLSLRARSLNEGTYTVNDYWMKQLRYVMDDEYLPEKRKPQPFIRDEW